MNNKLRILSGTAILPCPKPSRTTWGCPWVQQWLRPSRTARPSCRSTRTFVGVTSSSCSDLPTGQPEPDGAAHHVDAVRRASAHRITAVLPFFGYARQDRKDRPRVPITAKLVANLLVAAGVNRVLTMDLHAGQIQGFFDIPVDHLYASPVLIKAIRERGLEDIVVVSPDVGGLKMSHAYAKALGAPFAIVAKNRISAEEVEALSVIGDVKDRNVLLVDDLTESAGTLTAAARLLAEKGAKNIYAGVSHGVLSEKGHERLKNSPIIELFSTDSVPQAHGNKVTVLSVAPLLGEAIKRIHSDESVTSLFDIRG